MHRSGVQRRDGQPRGGAGEPSFDLLAAKLLRPHVRAETIRRTSLIDRLAKDDGCLVVSVVAPAGYGKTTMLSQWAQSNSHAFAWVSVDEKDNDPKVLLAYVAEALDAVEPVGERVFEALASRASSVPGSVVPRLVNAFSSMTAPVALVLDDVHLLDNSECRAALSVLAGHVPAGSRLVLAGRTDPPVRVARLRAEGRLMEIGPADLSLTREEAATLLRAAEVALGDADVAELHERTEGWPVGLYLAALYLREGGSFSGAAASFGGDDRLVSEYLESEFLARISRQQRVFLTRTAVLERLSGPLCEAVLDQPGSAATLAVLARSNLLLVPLDRRSQWYRYHHLFRDMLVAELERLEPDLIPALQRRAAEWSLRQGSAEEALEYFMAAGDVDQVAGLVQSLWHRTYNHGRTSTLQRWFGWLDDRGGINGYPMIAIMASLLAAATGRPAEAERWADEVDRWQRGNDARLADPHTEGWAALLWALLCRGGIDQMCADAEEAARQLAAANVVIPVTGLLQGVARLLSGDLDAGEAFFADAIALWEAGAPDLGAPDVIAETLGERSLVAMARNQWAQAEAFASRASAVMCQAGLEDPLVYAVQARVALHRGDAPAVRRELASAQRVRSLFTHALPHLAVQTRLELVRVHLALADLTGARTLMREIDDLLRRRPALGTLVSEAQTLRAHLSQRRGPDAPGASALTAAELRLLPLLSTHLTFAEIGAELFLSPNTIKTQAVSIYRKLNASTRSQAVARSRELGLLEGYSTAFHPAG